MRVCFSDATGASASFASWRDRIRSEVQATWGATVSMSFHDFRPKSQSFCATSGVRQVLINISDAAPVTYPNVVTGSVGMSLPWPSVGVPGSGGNDHTVVHEFGHALGFLHEFERGDGSGGKFPGCPQSPSSGLTMLTPADPNSIMLTTYCDDLPDATKLSPWDEFGAIRVYGKRNMNFDLLTTWYSANSTDYSSEISYAADDEHWSVVGVNGWVFSTQQPGTVPLTVLRRKVTPADYMSTTDAALIATERAKGGWVAANAGYVYTTPQPGAIPLYRYYNASLDDYLTTTRSPPSGYSSRVTEGYIFAERPFVSLWTYYHAGTTDFATAMENRGLTSSLSTELENAGFEFRELQGFVMRYEVEGTQALHAYYHPTRKDTHLTTTPPAQVSGWTYRGVQGYIYTSASGGGQGDFNVYRNSSQNDYASSFVAIELPRTGYDYVETLGRGFPLSTIF